MLLRGMKSVVDQLRQFQTDFSVELWVWSLLKGRFQLDTIQSKMTPILKWHLKWCCQWHQLLFEADEQNDCYSWSDNHGSGTAVQLRWWGASCTQVWAAEGLQAPSIRRASTESRWHRFSLFELLTINWGWNSLISLDVQLQTSSVAIVWERFSASTEESHWIFHIVREPGTSSSISTELQEQKDEIYFELQVV